MMGGTPLDRFLYRRGPALLKVCVVLVVVTQFVSHNYETQTTVRLAWGVALTLLFISLGFAIRRARNAVSPDGDLVLDSDPRLPILYLRSFQRDDDDERQGRLDSLLLTAENLFTFTFEQHLTALFEDTGPIIAVGCPDEILPPAGAARIYLSEDDWKPRVGNLIDRSRIVICSVSDSPGVRWELSQVIERCSPRSVLLELPRKKRERARVWNSVNETLPCRLKNGKKAWLYTFDEQWTPIPLRYVFRPLANTEKPGEVWKATLLPFFQRNNLEMEPAEPILRIWMVLLLVVVGFVLCIAIIALMLAI